jgi:hypothetical protein
VDQLLTTMSAGLDATTEKELAQLLGDLAEAGAVDRLPA